MGFAPQGTAEAKVAEISKVADVVNELSDTVASTTSTLAAGGEYTSDAFTVDGWRTIVGNVYSDVPGKLIVEQRSDGANWDAREEIPYGGGRRVPFEVQVVGNEARVRYVNNSYSAQSDFRLHVRLRRV